MVTDSNPFAVALGTAVVAVVFVVVLFRAMWRVAEPNEALIISGFRSRRIAGVESMGFKIVTGHGTLVLPGVQVVRKLSLDLNEAELSVDCVTQQGIPVHLKAVVIYKVGDDFASIANAARRFLDQQDRMDARIRNVFAGHLRAICGSLTMEELIRERDKLTEATRSASGVEMEKLGLVIDSLQIQEIEDPTGYIQNLARPHAAVVQKDARIAQAHADKDATQTEQQSAALKAEAVRDSAIKQAQFQADIDRAAAQARLAGPLAEATARQTVVVEETKVAQLEAERREQELQVSVRKPADAAAYGMRTAAAGQRDADIAASEARARQVELTAEADAKRVRLNATAQAEATRQIGEAEASATQAKGLAEGNAIKARLMAEADAIRARAEALATNQEAVIGQALAERWPQIVEAAAKAFDNVDQMIVLNGAQGVNDIMAQVMAQGASGLALARQLLAKSATSAAPAAPPLRRRTGRARRRGERLRARVNPWRRLTGSARGEPDAAARGFEDPQPALEAAFRHQLVRFAVARRSVASVLAAERRLEIEARALAGTIGRYAASATLAEAAGRAEVARHARDGERLAVRQREAVLAQAAAVGARRASLEAALDIVRLEIDRFRTERLGLAARVAAARARAAVDAALEARERASSPPRPNHPA